MPEDDSLQLPSVAAAVGGLEVLCSGEGGEGGEGGEETTAQLRLGFNSKSLSPVFQGGRQSELKKRSGFHA